MSSKRVCGKKVGVYSFLVISERREKEVGESVSAKEGVVMNEGPLLSVEYLSVILHDDTSDT